MKKNISFTCALIALAVTPVFAQDFKAGGGKEWVQSEPVEALYEGGRGLITLEGPTGMFLNPTSGTLPGGAFTLQYCFLLPTNDFSEVMGNGLLLAYGITDFLEVGVMANYIAIDGASDPASVGPQVRIRLLKDTTYLPEFSIGYYGRFGDDPLDQHGIYAAAFKRLPIGDESGVVKSLGFHAGVRQVWDTPEDDDTFRVYGGMEVQLPLRLYLVGEVSSKDNVPKTPYAYGVQWRFGGINVSIAGMQDGTFKNDAFWFGIGTALSF